MSTSLKIACLLAAAASLLAACGKPAQQAAATPAANAAPVKWDETSNDPAKNLTVANKEASVQGFNP